jgi:hypothetical protein
VVWGVQVGSYKVLSHIKKKKKKKEKQNGVTKCKRMKKTYVDAHQA